MIGKQAYAALLFIVWVFKAAAELSELPQNQTSSRASEVLHDTVSSQLIKIISINMIEFSGMPLDSVSADMKQALQENELVQANVPWKLGDC